MRTFTLLSLIIAFLQMNAQPFQITFTGSGMSSAVNTVEVLNLTQGTTLTITGTDILELVTNIGIKDNTQAKGEMVIYPNPAENCCRLEFYNRQTGDVKIKLFDAAGKLLLQNEDYLTTGGHTYDLAGLKSGMYVLKVNTPSSTYSSKIISTGFAEGLPLLGYAGGNSQAVYNFRLASTAGIIQMQYNAGEMLLFKGISGIHSRVLTLIPAFNQAINFEFIDCTDGEGNHYPVVSIGTQTWMAENLKTAKYRNGNSIPIVTDSSTWTGLTTAARCWYDNYANPYGYLYNFYAVNDSNGLCPLGWHVPASGEWTTLTDFLGGASVAGGHLKETGLFHWNSPNTGADNSSGFTALPGGKRDDYNGNFQGIGSNGGWWSSNSSGASNAIGRSIGNAYITVVPITMNRKSGYSVRCVRD